MFSCSEGVLRLQCAHLSEVTERVPIKINANNARRVRSHFERLEWHPRAAAEDADPNPGMQSGGGDLFPHIQNIVLSDSDTADNEEHPPAAAEDAGDIRDVLRAGAACRNPEMQSSGGDPYPHFQNPALSESDTAGSEDDLSSVSGDSGASDVFHVQPFFHGATNLDDPARSGAAAHPRAGSEAAFQASTPATTRLEH